MQGRSCVTGIGSMFIPSLEDWCTIYLHTSLDWQNINYFKFHHPIYEVFLVMYYLLWRPLLFLFDDYRIIEDNVSKKFMIKKWELGRCKAYNCDILHTKFMLRKYSYL